MDETGTVPEFECFDAGIVRCVDMFVRTGVYPSAAHCNFVKNVESGMQAGSWFYHLETKQDIPVAVME